jgi:hypothetical protein
VRTLAMTVSLDLLIKGVSLLASSKLFGLCLCAEEASERVKRVGIRFATVGGIALSSSPSPLST